MTIISKDRVISKSLLKLLLTYHFHLHLIFKAVQPYIVAIYFENCIAIEYTEVPLHLH